jgi:two-component system sensor histidine kinase CpxA
MLERALANLLRNAVRYSGDEALPIEIDTALQGKRIILCVRDRGPGVPESALARLGEPFFRPELSRSRAMGGVGLGLAIVRRCVAACDGTVIFRNRPGGGFEAQLELHSA